jgi:integrase
MAQRILTDRKLRALEKQPAAEGKTYLVPDGEVRGLHVRVMPSGQRSFVLVSRFPGSSNPTRRSLGAYGTMTLEAARAKARLWLDLIGKGIDPAIEEERQRQAEIQRQENTFAAVVEAFIAEKLPTERKGREVERDIRGAFLPLWGKRPITDISDIDVLTVIKGKKKSAPAQARNLLGYVSRLFDWAIDQRVYGLKISPCQNLKPSKIIGEKPTGDRILSDAELFAFWRTIKRLPYPYSQVYQLLVLTALRLNEVADASWSEFDLANKLWIVPSARMKGKNSKARAHAVPLTDDLLAILQSLPRFKKGDYLFSTTFGEKPTWMSDKIKKRVDVRMLATLRALARQRGDDPTKVELAPWINHDIRRTVRSHLSRLKITEEAREAVLAHARPGIKGVYDLHDYADEKREALELWAARLRSIVEPRPENVIPLIKARA